MKLKFNLFDHPSDTQPDPALPSPEERNHSNNRPIQVVEYVTAATLPESERISRLLETIKCYVEREKAFMHAPGLQLVYAMLGGDEIGKTVFDSLDGETKSLYLTMSKKVQDKLKEVYLERKFDEGITQEEIAVHLENIERRQAAGEFE